MRAMLVLLWPVARPPDSDVVIGLQKRNIVDMVTRLKNETSDLKLWHA